MQSAPQTFAEWIDRTTVENITKKINVSENTVYSWTHRNYIPRKVWPDLILAFSDLGIRDLIAMEKHARPSGAE